jgi:hypothetical protein
MPKPERKRKREEGVTRAWERRKKGGVRSQRPVEEGERGRDRHCAVGRRLRPAVSYGCRSGDVTRGSRGRRGRGYGWGGPCLGRCRGPTQRNSNIFALFKLISTELT